MVHIYGLNDVFLSMKYNFNFWQTNKGSHSFAICYFAYTLNDNKYQRCFNMVLANQITYLTHSTSVILVVSLSTNCERASIVRLRKL